MGAFRLLLADRHELVRLGVKAIVEGESDLQLVAELDDAGDAIAEVKRRNVDVALLGVEVRSIDGIDACRRIRAEAPRVKVLMLTSRNDEETVFAAITAGASGYLLKSATRREFLHAVRSVAEGRSYLDPAVTDGVLDRFKALTAVEEEHATCNLSRRFIWTDELLSKREREVFSLLVEGCTNKDIAERLVISEHTARNHVSHILHKLNISRRRQLSVIARGNDDAE